MLEPSTEMGMAVAVTWADQKPLPSWVTFQGWGTQDKGVHVRSLPPHCRQPGTYEPLATLCGLKFPLCGVLCFNIKKSLFLCWCLNFLSSFLN